MSESKKNTTERYASSMSEQSNKESIIRMTEQIKSLGEKVDGFIDEVRRGFSEIKEDTRAIEGRYATKEELQELKRGHQSLVRYLMGIVITIITALILGVMAIMGLKQ